MNGYDKSITIGVIFFVFVIILTFVIYLYQMNTTNIQSPNAYQFRRLYHRKSKTYVIISLRVGNSVDTIETPDVPGYTPVLSVGGKSRDPLGLWNFIPNTTVFPGKTVWSIQNDFSYKYQNGLALIENEFNLMINGMNHPVAQSDIWLELVPVIAPVQNSSDTILPPLAFRMNVVNHGPIYWRSYSSYYPSILRVKNMPDSTEGDIFELRVPIPSS